MAQPDNHMVITNNINQAVAKLEHYIGTYRDQPYWTQYHWKTFVDDILYGLGIALDPEGYYGGHGFDQFLTDLWEYLDEIKTQQNIPSVEDVHMLAVEVLGTRVVAQAWLDGKTPYNTHGFNVLRHQYLGDKTPRQVLENDPLGPERVEKVLLEIDKQNNRNLC